MRIIDIRLAATSAMLVAASLAATGAAFAQVPPRTRGTITAVSGSEATLRTAMGKVTIKLADDTGYVGAKKSSLDDVKQGSFIGTAATPAADGTLRALEVAVFPESMRGAGEGNYAWDLGKAGSMTNGTVSSMTDGTVSKMSGGSASGSSMTNGTVGSKTAHGHSLMVDYKGGQKLIMVPDSVPVVALEPGDKSLLKAGAKVVVFGPVNGTTVDAKRIIVGEDGVKPPM